jgi:hypothetical protein
LAKQRGRGKGLGVTLHPSGLKQRLKLIEAESGLFNDGTERARLEVAARMDWHGDGSRRIAGEDPNVMTADDPICHES